MEGVDAELVDLNAQVPPGRENLPGGPWASDELLAAHYARYADRGNITLLAEETSADRIVGFADLWASPR